MIHNINRIELVYNMFWVHNNLKENKIYEKSSILFIKGNEKKDSNEDENYNYFEESLYYDFYHSNFHYSKKIKTFWENVISKTFFSNLDLLKNETNDIETLIKESILFMKNYAKTFDNLFEESDPFINRTMKMNIFKYISGKSCYDFINDLLTNNNSFIESVKNLIESKSNNELAKTIPNLNNIHTIIKNNNSGFLHFCNESNMFLSYLIPKNIIIDNNYEIESIIGVGTYGCVVKYNHCKKSICLKIYFKDNNEQYVLEKIKEHKELNDIIINSYYLEQYSFRMLNNINMTEEINERNDYRNIQYLIMDYGKQIDKTFITSNDFKGIFNFTFQIIDKIRKLLRFGIYFTDLKLQNIILNNDNEVRFIDLDSFYFLEKGNKAYFSYVDVVSDIIPLEKKKININSNNAHMLEKVMVRKIAILIMDFLGFDILKMKKEEFPKLWREWVNKYIENIYLNEHEVQIFKSMLSFNRYEIPNIEDVYVLFQDLKNKINDNKDNKDNININ